MRISALFKIVKTCKQLNVNPRMSGLRKFVYTYNRISFILKRQGNSVICNNTDKYGGCYAK